MGRLKDCRKSFENRLSEGEDLLDRSLAAVAPGAARGAFTATQRSLLHELILLRAMISLERMLETAFGLYAIGYRETKGHKPKRLKKVDTTLPQMLELLRGDQDYVGWISTDTVMKRADRWFAGGEPFRSALTPAATILTYAKLGRNVVAHESASAISKYSEKTRRLYGSVPRSLSVGSQLQQPPPSTLAVFGRATLLAETIETMRAVGAALVPS